jgi:hypothetical protein
MCERPDARKISKKDRFPDLKIKKQAAFSHKILAGN